MNRFGNTCIETCYKEGDIEGLLRGVEKLAYYQINKRNPILPNYMSEDDLVQELQIKVWEGLHKYDPSKSNIVSYCSTIISRHIFNVIRNTNTGYKNGDVSNTEDELDMVELTATSDEGGSFDRLVVEFTLDLDKLLTEEEVKILELRRQGVSVQKLADKLEVTGMTIYRKWNSLSDKIKNWVIEC